MAKVPLRLYIREIENLIDRGQTEEALAHCKYILETYPKCIDVYRLLGKAYLETQRYGEAADILQRVLSSVPDDFVAHVGMSIIREDEGDLNASVWHMERAYEAQPSNGAVQEELRRLYGRRDGAEPPKIRMTRGALVRMYARGHLYEQAIAEVRAALEEDAQRSDLQVILARLYAQTGARVEATALCSELITKYPYCFEANRILSEILPANSRADEIATYKQRVVDLDPYMGFASVERPVDEVSDQEITLERLEWEPSPSETGQPAWASNIGINLEAEGSDDAHVLPDWLASISSITPNSGGQNQTADRASSPASAPIFSSEPAKSAPPQPPVSRQGPPPATPHASGTPDASLELPDWMKESGWSSAGGPVHEEPFVFEETSHDNGEAVMNTDLPDWLQGLAPAQENEPAEAEEAAAAEQFAWLEDISKAKATGAQIPAAAPQRPDWLETPQEPAAVQEQPAEEPTPEPAQAAQEEPMPAWFDLTHDEEAVDGSGEESGAPEIPEWLEKEEPAQDAAAAASEPAPSLPLNKEDTLAWLEDLAEEHYSEAPTLVIRPSERVAQPPSWIDEAETEPDFVPEIPAEPVKTPPQPEMRPASLSREEKDHVESLLNSIGDTMPVLKGEPLPFQPTPPASPAQVAEPAQAVQPVQPVQPAKPAEITDDFPAWLLELAGPGAKPPAPAPRMPRGTRRLPELADEAPLPSPDFGEQDDEKAAMAWLDQLAATLPETPEPAEPSLSRMREEIAASWTPEAVTPIEPVFEQPVDLAPAPLESVAPAELPVEEVAIPQPVESESVELPDWLKMIEQPEQPAEQPAQVGENGIPVKAEAELDAWLRENANIADLPVAAPPVETLPPAPVMIAPEQEPAPEPEPEPASVQSAEAEEAIPTWLQDLDLVVNQPGQAEAVPPISEAAVATPAEEKAEPDWLQSLEPVVPIPPMPEIAQLVEPEASVEEAPEVFAEAAPIEPVLVEDTQPVSLAPQPAVEEIQPVEPEPVTPAAIEVAPEPVLELETPAAAIEPLQPVAEEAAPALVEEVEPVVAETPVVEQAPARAEIPQAQVPPPSISDAEPPQKPVAAVAPTPAEPAAPARVFTSEEVQEALENGQLEPAITYYDQTIHAGEKLEETIHELRQMLYRYPVDISLWQLLGDAYLRTNCLQDAIDSYTKAEELIR